MGAELALQPDESRHTLPRFFADVCSRHGDRPALRDDRGGWSFTELEREAHRVARGLIGSGLAKGRASGC